MTRLTLSARWQHHVVRDLNFSEYKVHPGIRSAQLYEKLGKRIAARDPDGADVAARELISFHQSRFGPLPDAYLAERTRGLPRTKRRASRG